MAGALWEAEGSKLCPPAGGSLTQLSLLEVPALLACLVQPCGIQSPELSWADLAWPGSQFFSHSSHPAAMQALLSVPNSKRTLIVFKEGSSLLQELFGLLTNSQEGQSCAVAKQVLDR